MKRFKIAIAVSGMSVDEFAKMSGVARGFIYQVLDNPNLSERTSKKIDEFIEQELQKLGIKD